MYFDKKSWTGVLSVILLSVLSYSSAAGMGASQRVPNISIEAQEARVSPMIIGSASVFMNISNTGESDDALIKASLDIPNAVAEIHDTKDGKMVKVEKVRIPSRTVVALKPGGMHIMVFHMPEDVREGYEFKMHLLFERSGEKQVNVKLTGTDSHSNMHH